VTLTLDLLTPKFDAFILFQSSLEAKVLSNSVNKYSRYLANNVCSDSRTDGRTNTLETENAEDRQQLKAHIFTPDIQTNIYISSQRIYRPSVAVRRLGIHRKARQTERQYKKHVSSSQLRRSGDCPS